MSIINKEEFVKFMGYIKQTMGKEEKIDAFVRELSFDGYCYMLSDEIHHMIEMVCAGMGIDYETEDPWGNDIEYFIFELEWGLKWRPDALTEADGTPIDISTVEKLYDYLANIVKAERENN